MPVNPNMADDSTNGTHDELDDWETLDDSGEIDRQLDKLKKNNRMDSLSEQMSNQNDSLQFGRVKILQNDTQRTQYQPQIKILRREPIQNDANGGISGMGERKPSFKTLEQREAEYAEARKRIMGEEENNTEITDNSITMHRSPGSINQPVISRQPQGPDTSSKGFKDKRTPPNS